MRIRSAVLGLCLAPLPACMEQNFQSWEQPEIAPHTEPILRLEPEHHDFGSPWVGCGLEQTFRIHNDGDGDLVVDDVGFDAGSAELALIGPERLPITVLPGEFTTVSVSYLGADTTEDFGQLVVSSNDPGHERATGDVRGAAKSPAPILDAFEQPFQPQSDILVVIDNSGSMQEEQLALTANFQQFMDAMVAAHADFRVAVLTTDSPTFVGPVVSLATPNPLGEFNRQVLSVGIQGAAEERPIDMVVESTSPGGDAAPGGAFWRDEAMLGVIVVTDEPDEFSTPTPQQFVDHLVRLKQGDASQVKVHTIGGDVPVPACAAAAHASVPLDEVVGLTGGIFTSVCGDWGSTLTAVALGSVALADTFVLSEKPDEASLAITVDGADVPTGWVYDDAQQAVVFDLASIPPSESHVEIAYRPWVGCDEATDPGDPGEGL